ncbi:hypothetical protein [Bdellovibrio reynosensis]|uniref:Uncharacterized protein n=1 Tax=Bdellovibrio reynosensis TaxID=2835041 RepID=A0ABY4C846_9BACT|nr:hypothetical protein [Bdellovibrio reynosensis]UOF01161.1 hypothetical protein MNR06_15790 [Bdellovibrio reynosensis]
MTKMLTLTMTLFLSFGAYAQVPQHVELCELEIWDEREAAFAQEDLLNIKQEANPSAIFAKLVEQHFATQYEQTLPYAEIRQQFLDGGDNDYNDLYIHRLTHKASGKVYLEVKSYPGDNPYGAIYTADGYKMLATNSDSSIDLITKNGTFSCYEINKDKYE